MPEKSSENPIGKRYLRYVRGLPAHPELAFGQHADRWKFRNDARREIFTATRQTRGRVWRVIFELDTGDAFLQNGNSNRGNLLHIESSLLNDAGGLIVRNSGAISIDGDVFSEQEVLFYKEDGRLMVIFKEYNRIARNRPGMILGFVPHETLDLLCGPPGGGTRSADDVCDTAGMVDGVFHLKCHIVPAKNQAVVRLERGQEDFVSHTVPLRITHPREAIDCLRQKINSLAGAALM